MSDTAALAAAEKAYGFVEGFRPGEHERAERALDAMKGAGVRRLRTELSWAVCHGSGGEAWYDWLIPMLGAAFELLPCVHETPASLSRTGAAAGAPKRLEDYADFVYYALTRFGRHFEAVELWNEPNDPVEWDRRDDPDWLLFSEMIGAAAQGARRRGFKTVLGGSCPFDADWLRLMGERGVLRDVNAVGLHGFPGDSGGEARNGWDEIVSRARTVLDDFAPEADVWITEAGHLSSHPAGRRDEAAQAQSFLRALAAPAERVYWCGWQDAPNELPHQEQSLFDKRRSHTGAVDAFGQPKLLARLLASGGATAVRDALSLATPHLAAGAAPVVVAGGAGFIGSNLADSYLAEGRDVVLLDNLSRPGVERNLAWLKAKHGSRVHWQAADTRDETPLREILRDAAAVFHFAAQVAVTTSLVQPVEDFEINARGTLNILEAVRRSGRAVPVIFASTNKVYGDLSDLDMREQVDRYVPADNSIAAHGIGETRNLDFSTPYGCSKGVADQYVLDYAKSFGLPTAVLRMSCIYGPRQFGTEDQGWVAHFLIRAMRGESLTIYGDGKQVRDILHVADAVRAYRALLAAISKVKGQAFNLGGGPDNAVSLKTVLKEIAQLVGGGPPISYGETRQGDQTYFVADTRKLTEAVGWRATIGWKEGLRDLHSWLGSVDGAAVPAKPRAAAVAPLPVAARQRSA